MNKYGLLLFNCTTILLLLVACWDSVSIEDRGFVIGTAIDMKEQKGSEYTFSVTDQFVIPLNVPSAANQGGSGGEEPFMNLSAEGKSLVEIDHKMSNMTDKLPFFEHMKIIIISEEIAQIPHLFANLLDIYIRNPEMRRGTKVAIAKEGKALLDSHPKAQKLPAIYMETLLKQSATRGGLFEPKVVGDIQEELLRRSSFVLPMLTPKEGRVEYKGGVVFNGHKDKVVGTLTEKEMVGLNLILGNNKSGVLNADFKGDMITAEINNLQNKATVDPSNVEHIQATITIKVEATIRELFGAKSLQSKKNLKQIEESFSNHIKELVQELFEKGKNELNSDIFQLDFVLQTRHPDIWKKVKNDWDHGNNYFSSTTVDVKVDTTIQSSGNANRTINRNE